MVNRQSALVSAALIALMVVAGLWALSVLPVDARVPIHFNYEGEADGWARPWIGLFVSPAIAAAIWVVQALLPRIDPRGQNLARSPAAYGTIWIAITVVMTILQAIIICSALGMNFNRGRLLLLLVAGLLIVIGNVMGKLRWNYTVGIRTPWTLADERVWDKTHRFGGRALVLGGMFIFLAAFIPEMQGLQGLLIAVITGGVCLVTIAKSYLYWRAGGQHECR
jgi:uncharacterized membrane protein